MSSIFWLKWTEKYQSKNKCFDPGESHPWLRVRLSCQSVQSKSVPFISTLVECLQNKLLFNFLTNNSAKVFSHKLLSLC